MIAQLKRQGYSQASIARMTDRHRSTISRELKRNATPHDGWYRADKAIGYTRARRSRSRRNWRYTAEKLKPVIDLLHEGYSPEQASAVLKMKRVMRVSIQTIYAFLKRDRKAGGELYKLLRLSSKLKRKRYDKADSRGRLRHKRSIHERPNGAENRSRVGHWEIDTVMGKYGSKPCLLTLVDRKTGYALIGKLADRTVASMNERLKQLIARYSQNFKTITADNGTEFHGYKEVEEATDTPFYFADPYHSWQRGSNENLNGLIRQYFPKGMSLVNVTQADCDRVAEQLNNRPRKRYGYKSPAQLFPAC